MSSGIRLITCVTKLTTKKTFVTDIDIVKVSSIKSVIKLLFDTVIRLFSLSLSS